MAMDDAANGTNPGNAKTKAPRPPRRQRIAEKAARDAAAAKAEREAAEEAEAAAASSVAATAPRGATVDVIETEDVIEVAGTRGGTVASRRVSLERSAVARVQSDELRVTQGA